MGDNSVIEWTNATWNPTTGCTKVSPGCKNCYAERLSPKLKRWGIKKYKNNFEFTQHEKELELPLKWKKEKKIFVNSMSDLFHEKAEFGFIERSFMTMIAANWHIYQILTKRPEKMVEFSKIFYRLFGFPIPPHIWMGTSIEDNASLYRISDLQKIKCYSRFISFEPLLEKLENVDLRNVDWAIIGGESGPKHRQIEEEWIWDLIRQCKKQKVKVFFKQWGGPRPKSGGRTIRGKTFDEFPKQKNLKVTHQKRFRKLKEKLDKVYENKRHLSRNKATLLISTRRSR